MSIEPEGPSADADSLRRERDAWRDAAERMCRNEAYYRGLVVRIGEAIGEPAYTCDDGSRSEDVLCNKVPELVEALVAGKGAK